MKSTTAAAASPSITSNSGMFIRVGISLGPPQTRRLFADNFLLTTIFYRQLYVVDTEPNDIVWGGNCRQTKCESFKLSTTRSFTFEKGKLLSCRQRYV